jgi:hypothetical protein
LRIASGRIIGYESEFARWQRTTVELAGNEKAYEHARFNLAAIATNFDFERTCTPATRRMFFRFVAGRRLYLCFFY